MTDPHITLDFETFPIWQRPSYPPVPVGLATKWPDQAPRYLAVRHGAGGNNAIDADIAEELHRAWDSGLPILCHNAKFDVEVACHHYKLPMLPWQRVHDTQYLAFLETPHARSLELKVLADQHLGMPPEERDAIRDWCATHSDTLPFRFKDQFGRLPSKDKGENFTPSRVGAWIWAAPGDVVAPYAIGDLLRTDGLFEHYRLTRDRMAEAYNRERQLMPILLRNEQQGLRVDLERLEGDIAQLAKSFELAEAWLRWRLNAPTLSLDSDEDTAERLNAEKVVTEWKLTSSGKRSTSKENLKREHYHDVEVFRVLGYRNRLKTTLDTFLRPWAEQAAFNMGRITTSWNQTRGGDGGTRTGRPSTSHHNFLNLPKAFEGRASDEWEHPTAPELAELRRLPLCRDYVLPEEGHLWLHRDFSGQELRVFAHFECYKLLEQYIANPDLDPHQYVSDAIKEIAGRELERTRVKNVNFGSLYGAGVPAIKAQAKCKTDGEAKELIALHNQALPGRKLLNDTIFSMAQRGLPIVTWGGRWYYPERVPGQDKRYKLLNYLVQGSSADITKQCLIEWDRDAEPWERFLVTVYDEINISAPRDVGQRALARLGAVMDAERIDCPMRSDAKIGTTWGNAVKENRWVW